MKALITCVSGVELNRKYNLLTILEGSPVVVESSERTKFNTGEAVDYSGNGLVAISEPKEELYKTLSEAVDSASEGIQRSNPYSIGIREIDEATERMWPKLEHAAKLLLRKLFFSVPIIIRFHNDADGSSGACSLYKSIDLLYEKIGAINSPYWIMHKGISYRKEDAGSDTLFFNAYSSYEKPLIIMVDFGTSPESNEGIGAIKDKADIIWLDHHPLHDDAECQKLKYYINPWQFSSDSNYTAGTLASIFASILSNADVKEFIYSSMIGDYSDYRVTFDDAMGTAAILDMLTSDPTIIGSSDNISPKELLNAVNGQKRQELLNFANVVLNEVLDNSFKESKRYETQNGIAIYVLDYERVKPESKYPLPGRFSSKFLERLEEKEKSGVIVMVHAGAYISIRSNVSNRAVSIKRAIELASESKPGLIESYGGHEYASSVKVRIKESKPEVITALVNAVKSMDSKEVK